jgi:hypothetical protein
MPSGTPESSRRVEDTSVILPDERAMIDLRLDMLDAVDEDDLLTADEVGENLGIDLE